MGVTGRGDDSYVQALFRFAYKESAVTSYNLIWPVTGLARPQFRAINSPDIVQLASSNAADTASGNGMRKVKIRGIGVNWTPVEETLWLNGTTPVSTSNKYQRIIQMWGLRTGTSESNVGAIFAGYGVWSSNGRPASIWNTIVPAEGQTFYGAGHIPQQIDVHVHAYNFQTGRTGGGQDVLATFRLRYRQIYGQQVGSFEYGPWRTRVIGSAIDRFDYQTDLDDFVLQGPCDIYAEAFASATGARLTVALGSELHVRFQDKVPTG